MKYFNNRVFIFLTIITAGFFFIYLNYFQKEKIDEKANLEVKKEISTNSNIIKNIKYSSKDLKGNQYIIFAEEGEIDLKNNDIIFLKKVIAYIKLSKNNDTITITSDFGKYNTLNFDTIFSKNVNVDYIDNNLNGNYLDFSMKKNLLIISKDVVFTSPENSLKADVIELNTINKDAKIFMYNSTEKVEIKNKK